MKNLFFLLLAFAVLPFNSAAQPVLEDINQAMASGKWDKLTQWVDSLDESREQVFLKGYIFANLSRFSQESGVDEVSATEQAREFLSEVMSANDELAKTATLQLRQLWSIKMNDGAKAYAEQDFSNALKKFKLGVVLQPMDTTAYLYAATVAASLGDKSSMVEMYEGLCVLSPVESNYQALINSYRIAGETEKMEALLQKIATPEKALLFELRIQLLLQANRYEDAYRLVNESISKYGKDADLLLRLGQVGDALEDRERTKLVQNDSLIAGLLAQSEQAYLDVLDLREDDFTALFNLAVLYHRKANDLFTALNKLANENYRKSSKDLIYEAELLLKRGVIHMKQARKQEPDNLQVLKALQAFYLQLRWNDHLDEIKDAIAAIEE